MAFQSIKKLLPESCKCLKSGLLTDLRARLSRPPPTLPAGYLSFAREISSEIFAKGWDRSWLDKVDTFAPSLSSCQGFSRKQGGQLAALAVTGHEHYKERMTGAPFGELEGELLVVDSSGKPRPLTRFGPESAFLRPLHGLMYDTISRKKWLLRGEVTEAALNEAGFDPTKKVELPLTSGDYKSASDNLSIEVAETILDVAWGNSQHVPANVFRYAMAAQRPRLQYEGEDHLKESFTPTRGQMMGSYLCFPLLCLQNYIAFRYAEKVSDVKGTPVLINGDDILFQSEVGFSNRWMEIVGSLSLEVEKTKTSVSSDFGSLNSTLLRWFPSGLRPIKTLRFGMLRECGHPGNLGVNALKFSRVGPRATWLTNFREFLSWHEATIIKWRCVLSDMGFSGRLARRAFQVYRGGRLLMRDDIFHSLNLPRLDPPPCPHNIVMGGSEFIKVASCFVTREVQRETARWMSSRKWELGESFESSKVTKLVSKRANATQIESSLNSRNNPLAWWKERAVACSQKRAEYYFYSTDLGTGLLRMAGLKKKFHFWKNRISTKREVAREAGWWRGRLDPEGEVRVPIPVWKQFHPDWFGLEGFSLFKKPQEPVPDPIPSALKENLFLVSSQKVQRMLLNGVLRSVKKLDFSDILSPMRGIKFPWASRASCG
nr:MAG: RNA-dependent RNA polymerase [Botourmiaviridae sp.]